MSAPFDPGLQSERTELAWRRTALAIGVGALVSLRLLPGVFDDPWWTLIGVGGLCFTSLIWLMARCRLRTVSAALHADGDHPRLPGAAPLALLSMVVFSCGVVGLILVLEVA